MAFHITVICADPAVEAALAAAFEHPCLAKLRAEHSIDISWRTSAADISPHSDLAIVYSYPPDPQPIIDILPIFSHTRILRMTRRSNRGGRCGAPQPPATPWDKIKWIVLPFDAEHLYLWLRNMIQMPRIWYGPLN